MQSYHHSEPILCHEQDQNSYLPYSVKKDEQGNWGFELAFSAEMTPDNREEIMRQISVCTGMIMTTPANEEVRLFQCGNISPPLFPCVSSIIDVMGQNNLAPSSNKYIESFFHHIEERPDSEIIGEKLFKQDCFCIETEEHYRERISAKIERLKSLPENQEADFLCAPALLTDNKAVKKIFNAVMEEHGYSSFSSNSKNNHVLWVKKEKQALYSYEKENNVCRQLLEQDINETLASYSSLHLFKKKEGSGNTLFAILIPDPNGQTDDYVTSLCWLKQRLENDHAKRVSPPATVIIQNNSNVPVALTPAQADRLRKAGFVLAAVAAIDEEKEELNQEASSTVYKIYSSSQDKLIKDVYDKLKEITQNYVTTHAAQSTNEEKKNEDDKSSIIQPLLDALTDESDFDLQKRIQNFEGKLGELLKNKKQMDTINQHRTGTFLRYIGNIFSVLRLLIPLGIRAKNSYEKYGIYQFWKSEFWQPESAQLIHSAQNELKKLTPKA